jgi:hypothetical protein
MAAFIRAIEQFAIVLYAACLAGMAWSLRAVWLAWRDRSETLFALERETASARIGRGVLSALGFIGLGLIVFVVAQFVAPSLPAAEAPTPTPPGPLVTLTPTYTPFPTPTPPATPTIDPALEATLAGATLEAPTPLPSPIPPPASCPDPSVQITAPRDGQTFSGPFQIFGTANIDNFGFYKFVLNGPATNFEDRTAGDVVTTPVVNNYLGTIDPSVLLQAPGAYRFSLVAVNNVGNEAPHCSITLQIVPP